jgi:hypothetical protein
MIQECQHHETDIVWAQGEGGYWVRQDTLAVRQVGNGEYRCMLCWAYIDAPPSRQPPIALI